MQLKAKGDSMLPTLVDGKIYPARKYEGGEIRVGEIVIYRVDQTNICHRIVRIITTKSGKVFYRLKGDNCEESDPYVVTRDMIIGIVEP